MKTNFLFYLASFILGGFYTFGYPQFLGQGLVGFNIICLTLFFILAQRRPIKLSPFLLTALFNLGFHLIGFYWVGGTLQEFGQLPLPIAHFLGLFLSFLLNPFMWIYYLWIKYSVRFNFFQQRSTLFKILWLAIFLTTAEIILPQQFPVYLGHTFFNLAPYLTFAPIFGVFFYSFIGFIIAFSGFYYFQQKEKIIIIPFAGVLSLLLVQVFFPLQNFPKNEYDILSTRIVQANIGNFIKISSEKGEQSAFAEVIERYKELSLKDAPELDLIIWPETAYPFTLPSQNFLTGDEPLPSLFEEILAQTGAHLVLGGYDQKNNLFHSNFENDFNAVYHFSPEGRLRNVYHKHILIPFGETLPFGPFNKYLSQHLDTVSFFAKGKNIPAFEIKNKKFISPVCYEILDTFFIKYMLDKSGGAHFMINLTNDSWYGLTSEPRQHLFLAHWRALEFGMPIIRSTNTGITSILFPDGSESQRLDNNLEAALDVELKIPKQKSNTVYYKFGLKPLIGLWILLMVIMTFWELKRSRA